MTDNRKETTVANAKPAKPAQQSGALRRAAKALERAGAREKKARKNVDDGNHRLDAVLLALEKSDVGSPDARKVEKAARAALKELLAQRKKLRKARKAWRRAEAKERKAKDRAAPAAEKEGRARVPAAPARRPANKRPAKKRPTGRAARPKGTATTPAATTMPSAPADRGVDTEESRESAGAPERLLE